MAPRQFRLRSCPVLLVATGLILCFPAVGNSADSQCVRNFTSASNDTTFHTFVQVPAASRAELVEALAQEVALESFEDISANKDLGVVTAKQMSGKPPRSCPLSMTIRPEGSEFRVDVSFRLGEGLTSSPVAVQQALCKLLGPVLPALERNDAMAGGILLDTGNGLVRLPGSTGKRHQTGLELVILIFEDYPKAAAAVSTSLGRPILKVVTNQDPRQQFALVALKANGNDTRSLKMGSVRGLMKGIRTGDHTDAPDPDWTRPFEARQESPGHWLVQPTENLKTGQYGLLDLKGGILFDFAVDQGGRN